MHQHDKDLKDLALKVADVDRIPERDAELHARLDRHRKQLDHLDARFSEGLLQHTAELRQDVAALSGRVDDKDTALRAEVSALQQGTRRMSNLYESRFEGLGRWMANRHAAIDSSSHFTQQAPAGTELDHELRRRGIVSTDPRNSADVAAFLRTLPGNRDGAGDNGGDDTCRL